MGIDHCAWLDDDGVVWICGSNDCSQLGLEGDTLVLDPCRVLNLPPIAVVQTGYYSTFCLDMNGSLWSFGSNGYGQLGLGDTNTRAVPCQITSIPSVESFCFYYTHTACICNDGSIWTFGSNPSGGLGLGHQRSQTAPVQLPSSSFSSDIVSVSCGYAHSLFLTAEGQVFSCGNNFKGQLGQGDITNRSTPTLIRSIKGCVQITCGGHISCMVDSSHRLWVCGSQKGRQLTPLQFPSIGLVQEISIGYKHILCVNQNGELWGWGDPSKGRLGNDSTELILSPILLRNNIQHALAIGLSSFIREKSGKTFCSGKNSKGQLGIGTTFNQLSFAQFPEEKFRMRFPEPRRKIYQKSARSILP